MCVFYSTMICHFIVCISLYQTVKLHLYVCSYYGLRLSNLINYLLTYLLRYRWRNREDTRLPFQSNSSTSNTSVASGGIFEPEPVLPYAYSGLHSSTASSPRLIEATPMSHALITLPDNSNTTYRFISHICYCQGC